MENKIKDYDNINENNSEIDEDIIKTKLQKIKTDRLKKIKTKIDVFKKLECIEIYKIIKEDKQKFSQNKNGILFDLMKLKNTTIDKIEQFIKYIDNNSIIIEENENTKELLKLRI
jgi:hypothetical protein